MCVLFVVVARTAFKCYRCGICFTSVSSLHEHVKKHSYDDIRKKQSVKCDICGQVLTKLKYLERHMLIHSGEKPFPCQYCSERFRSTGELNSHAARHTSSEQHTCIKCNISFIRKETLNLHMKDKHMEGDRNFSCPHCVKIFKYKSTLDHHMESHSGMRNTHHIVFQCNHDMRSVY